MYYIPESAFTKVREFLQRLDNWFYVNKKTRHGSVPKIEIQCQLDYLLRSRTHLPDTRYFTVCGYVHGSIAPSVSTATCPTCIQLCKSSR